LRYTNPGECGNVLKLETAKKSRRVLKSRSQRLALIGVFIAIYVVLVEILPFISYGEINVRVADVLYGLTPFFPVEIMFAAPIATFLSDTTSAFGFYDFIGSTCVVAFAIFSCVQVQKRFSILGGFIVFDLILSSWLSWLVWWMGTGGAAPFWLIASLVFVGNAIAEIILPFSLYGVMKSRLRIGAQFTSTEQSRSAEDV
jgi:uncharacterized membrane protein